MKNNYKMFLIIFSKDLKAFSANSTLENKKIQPSKILKNINTNKKLFEAL